MAVFPLTFSQLADLLEWIHAIAPSRQTAFRARLKHLQRIGFPPGVNTGKGQRAQYGIEEVLLIALAIELLQLGITPERASGVLSSGRDIVLHEFKRALDGRTRIFGGTSALMYLDPRALLDLQDEDLFRVKVGKAYEALFFGTERDLGKHFQKRQHASSRLAVLDLRRVVTDMLTFIEEAEIGTAEEAIKEIVDWALDNGSDKKA